jgi:Tol biopolymer transport system component
VVSPNGKTTFYFHMNVRQAEQQIMAYDLETQRETEIFKGDVSYRTATGLVGVPRSDNMPVGRFAVSPDGSRIAFALNEKRGGTLTDPQALDSAPPVLVVMPATGGPVQKVRTPETLGLITIQWSPDGKDVLVQRGSGQLFWAPVDGGEPRRIGTGTFPAISSIRPDGKEIAVVTRSAGPGREVWMDTGLLLSRTDSPANNGAGENQNAGIYVASLDPVTGRVLGPPTTLSNLALGRTCSPAWSPDGRYISFSRRKSASGNDERDFNWVIRSVETGEEREFPVNSTDCWITGVWFHDNNSLLTQSFVEPRDRGRLRRRELNTGQLKSLNIPAYQTAMALSLDDKTLYMTVPDPKAGVINIVSVDLASGKQTHIWNAPIPSDTQDQVPLRLALSPDGRAFALTLTDSKKIRLVRVGSDGTGFKEIYSADAGSAATPSRSGLAWTRDGRSLLFMDEGKSEQRLMRISVNGGKPEFTGLTTDKARAVFDLSPDGRKIAFFSPAAPRIR